MNRNMAKREPLIWLPEYRIYAKPFTWRERVKIVVGSVILTAVICGLMFLLALTDVPR